MRITRPPGKRGQPAVLATNASYERFLAFRDDAVAHLDGMVATCALDVSENRTEATPSLTGATREADNIAVAKAKRAFAALMPK